MHILASASTITHLVHGANPFEPHSERSRWAKPASQINVSGSTHRLLHTAGIEKQDRGASGSEPRSFRRTTALAEELDLRDQRLIEDLRKRDREVRAHELAHLLAAGPHARGGPRFTYTLGPDGKRYAVGGEVPIDMRPVPGNPRATLQKAVRIHRAALAPLHPSGADLAVASKAATLAAQARQELLRMRQAEGDNSKVSGKLDASDAIASPCASCGRDRGRDSSVQHDVPSPPAGQARSPLAPSLIVVAALQSYHRAAHLGSMHDVTT
jgi:hypothetical protein